MVFVNTVFIAYQREASGLEQWLMDVDFFTHSCPTNGNAVKLQLSKYNLPNTFIYDHLCWNEKCIFLLSYNLKCCAWATVLVLDWRKCPTRGEFIPLNLSISCNV